MRPASISSNPVALRCCPLAQSRTGQSIRVAVHGRPLRRHTVRLASRFRSWCTVGLRAGAPCVQRWVVADGRLLRRRTGRPASPATPWRSAAVCLRRAARSCRFGSQCTVGFCAGAPCAQRWLVVCGRPLPRRTMRPARPLGSWCSVGLCAGAPRAQRWLVVYGRPLRRRTERPAVQRSGAARSRRRARGSRLGSRCAVGLCAGAYAHSVELWCCARPLRRRTMRPASPATCGAQVPSARTDRHGVD